MTEQKSLAHGYTTVIEYVTAEDGALWEVRQHARNPEDCGVYKDGKLWDGAGLTHEQARAILRVRMNTGSEEDRKIEERWSRSVDGFQEIEEIDGDPDD